MNTEAAEFSSEAKELRYEATELNSEATEFSPGRFARQFVWLCESKENLSEATQFSPGRFARQFVWFRESKESPHEPKVYVFQRKSMVWNQKCTFSKGKALFWASKCKKKARGAFGTARGRRGPIGPPGNLCFAQRFI